MNAKTAKALRRTARMLAGNYQGRAYTTIGFNHSRHAHGTVIVSPQTYKGIYHQLKKQWRTK